MHYAGDTLYATKVTGDEHVPAGQEAHHQAIDRLEIPHVDAGNVVTEAMERGNVGHALPRGRLKYIVAPP